MKKVMSLGVLLAAVALLAGCCCGDKSPKKSSHKASHKTTKKGHMKSHHTKKKAAKPQSEWQKVRSEADRLLDEI